MAIMVFLAIGAMLVPFSPSIVSAACPVGDTAADGSCPVGGPPTSRRGHQMLQVRSNVVKENITEYRSNAIASGERNASNVLVQLEAEAPDFGDYCERAGPRWWFNGAFQYVQLRGYWFQGGSQAYSDSRGTPNGDAYVAYCDDLSGGGIGENGWCAGFGSADDGKNGRMKYWRSTYLGRGQTEWPKIMPKHDWTICVVKDWFDSRIGFPPDPHACSYFTTEDACPCVWTGSGCQAVSVEGNAMWFVVWHEGHAEGEVHSSEETARAKFNDLHGGPFRAILYDQDLTEFARYGGGGQDDWQLLLEWAALYRKQFRNQRLEAPQCWVFLPTGCNEHYAEFDTHYAEWFTDPFPNSQTKCTSRFAHYNEKCGTNEATTVWGILPTPA